jgi:hypothetical protein
MARGSRDTTVLEEELGTDEEAGEGPGGRERKFPLLWKSRSMFVPVGKALARWRKMREATEERNEPLELMFIAELTIGPDEGFYYEAVGNGGHVLIWGDKANLAAAVRRVVPGDVLQEELRHGV